MNRFLALLLALPASGLAADGDQGHEQHQSHEEHQGVVGRQGQEGLQGHQGHKGHEGHEMTVDATGVVMNENIDQLPRGCDEISRDHEFTIYAGHKYASEPGMIFGMIFGMSEPEVSVEPCSRVNVTFVNEDEVRHQWMVHGLPKYFYPAGMFHIEAAGGTSRSGTFIVPAESRNYLIHCDMAQHMEMGMRGQLVVGGGGGDLWGIPGVSNAFIRAPYWPQRWLLWGAAALALSISILPRGVLPGIGGAADTITSLKGGGPNGTYLSIQVGLSEMKPNTQTRAITTDLISRWPGPIRRFHYPMNIAVQRCAALLGFT